MTAAVPYSAEYEPPCPVLTIRVAAPSGGAAFALLAVVDTGADITLVPEALARTLDLPVVSHVRIAGVTGAAARADVLAADIDLSGNRVLAEIVAFGNEAIVGRDLLNRLVLRLDGPRGILEVKGRPVSRPSGSRKRRPRNV